jgi:hypothetical protein
MHSSANLPNVQLSFWNNLPSCSSTPTLFMDMAVDLFFLVEPPLPARFRLRSGGGGAARFPFPPYESLCSSPFYLNIFCYTVLLHL